MASPGTRLPPAGAGDPPCDDGVLLVADLGATNLRLATVGETAHQLTRVDTFRCADHPGVEDALRTYLARHDIAAVSEACLAVAAPVEEDEMRLPNNHWTVSRERVQKILGAPVTVINDFTAQTLSLDALEGDDLFWFGTPRPEGVGVRLVLGPGTGLGVGFQTPSGDIVPSEGGHVSFAPTTDHETEILRILRGRFGRVSVERLLSGPGLENLYHANRVLSGESSPEAGDPPSAREIAARASGGDATALRSVHDFFDILASVAGDLALTTWSTGGVFLSGGVVGKLADFLDPRRFRARFEDKGRFQPFCRRMPVAWITHELPGLLGCAAALEQARLAAQAARP